MKISLTQLSKLPQVSYSKSSIINASQHTLYSIISQTQHYPRFIPFINNSRILKYISPVQNFTQLTISYNNFKQLSYISHVRMWPATSRIGQTCRIVSICKDQPLKKLQSIWQIQCKGQSMSYVKYHLQFQFNSRLYMLASILLKDYLGQQLWNIFQEQALNQQNITNNRNKFKANSKSNSDDDKYYEEQYQNNSINANTFGNSGINNTQNVSSINKPQAKPTSTSSSFTNSTNSTFASSASAHSSSSQKLKKFLNTHPQLKQIYLTNKDIHNKINILHKRLQNVQQYDHKMKYQINNLLTHL